MSKHQKNDPHNTTLKRGLSLPLVTLYGLGVTIGAGIYVLVGATAAKAGIFAPVSFILAAFVTGFTGLSYAELSTRMPVSAGEAAYVRAGFNSSTLALVVGLMVAASGVISSAAVSIGAASYLQHFISLPSWFSILLIVLVLGMTALWGIIESVSLAAIFTLVEISGLALVLYIGLTAHGDILASSDKLIPPFEPGAWSGILSASLLAFFAFVGFEDIANVAEEVKNPRHTMPWAIFLTLIISTLIYIAVVAVVVLAVPMDKLTGSAAPLALIFKNSGAGVTNTFNLIAVIATLNGVLIQMIMASRILYGLASQGELPRALAIVHPKTRTPVNATVLVILIILVLALLLPITKLAEVTSTIVLMVFTMVNLALIRLKLSGKPVAGDVFQIPTFLPFIGLLTCMALLLFGWI